MGWKQPVKIKHGSAQQNQGVGKVGYGRYNKTRIKVHPTKSDPGVERERGLDTASKDRHWREWALASQWDLSDEQHKYKTQIQNINTQIQIQNTNTNTVRCVRGVRTFLSVGLF